MPSARLPFRSLNLRQWLTLLSAALTSFYLILGLVYILSGKLSAYMGGDYRSYRASAEIAQTRGFAEIYSIRAQEQVQRRLYEEANPGQAPVPFVVFPTYLLPVFIVPFLPFTIFRFVPGFFLWMTLNALILAVYLRRFVKALGATRPSLLFRVMLCFPVFSTLFLGQVSVWLVICMGEVILASLRGKEFRSGLWLAGLLLKPQILILFIPGLLISRRFKALAGYALVASAILGISLLLVGGPGLGKLGRLYLLTATGEADPSLKAAMQMEWKTLANGLSSAAEPDTFAGVMMNWRALGINLSALVSPALGWGLAIGGMVLTIGVGLAFWFRPVAISSPRFGIVLLGTFAATCAATWHAHTHTVLPMIPLLVLLYLRRQLPWEALYLWLYGPMVVSSAALLIKPDIAYILSGLSMLPLNLFLLAWAARAFWHPGYLPTRASNERIVM